MKVRHEALEGGRDCGAAAQYHAGNAPFCILDEAVAEGFVIFAPDGIDIARMQLPDP